MTYKTTIRLPDELTVVTQVEKLEDCTDACPPAKDLDAPLQGLKEVRDEFEPEASADTNFSTYVVPLKLSKGRPCKLPILACRCAYFTYVYVNPMYCKPISKINL